MDISKLSGHIPANVLAQLPDTCSRFDIDGPLRLSHLLGQSACESGLFLHTVENLNYSGDALWSLFHTHFASHDEANSYAHQPERIANRIYASRMGNSDEQSGDGWLHRGVGYIQTTGKTNQGIFFQSVGLPADSDPQLIATTYPLASAAFFFSHNGLWHICDQGVDTNTIESITRHVNNGVLGLAERITYTQQYHRILTT